MKSFSIENNRGRNGTCRISLSGRFGDSAAMELEDRLNELLKEDTREARISLKGVSFLSSEGIGVLLGMEHSFRASGARLSLADLPPRAEADMKLVAGVEYFNRVTEL
ncbi:MAG: STAS domain-containing protein [Candidatus Latescibacteria bacterium]|nr:STAS domain-containing protein [bacterium]MBD3425143.1 STAS domain-containing protein [Candidatus Latescibacterota bacterium]